MKRFLLVCFLVVFATAVAGTLLAPKPKPLTAQEEAERKVWDQQVTFAQAGVLVLRSSAKDPETFELKSAVLHPNGVACYEYRAKNSFNAMLIGNAVLSAKKLYIHGIDSAFAATWNANCTKYDGVELVASK